MKVGDRVRGEYSGVKYTGTVIRIKDDSGQINRDDGVNYWSVWKVNGVWKSNLDTGADLIVINDSAEVNKDGKSIMTILDTIKLARKSEPEKTLVKAGLMNLDESLTTDGEKVLNDILVQTYKEEMKKVADVILKEREEK